MYQDFADLLPAFNALNVKYLIAGGYAALALFGAPLERKILPTPVTSFGSDRSQWRSIFCPGLTGLILTPRGNDASRA